MMIEEGEVSGLSSYCIRSLGYLKYNMRHTREATWISQLSDIRNYFFFSTEGLVIVNQPMPRNSLGLPQKYFLNQWPPSWKTRTAAAWDYYYLQVHILNALWMYYRSFTIAGSKYWDRSQLLGIFKMADVEGEGAVNGPQTHVLCTLKFRERIGKWKVVSSVYRSGGTAAGRDGQSVCGWSWGVVLAEVGLRHLVSEWVSGLSTTCGSCTELQWRSWRTHIGQADPYFHPMLPEHQALKWDYNKLNISLAQGFTTGLEFAGWCWNGMTL